MWLMGAQAPVLCDFLDALGIEHDEHGGIENLPEAPTADRLQTAVDGLLTKHPAESRRRVPAKLPDDGHRRLARPGRDADEGRASAPALRHARPGDGGGNRLLRSQKLACGTQKCGAKRVGGLPSPLGI